MSTKEISGQCQAGYVEKALQYIEWNYAQPITVDGLSSYVALCRGYFSRIFREPVRMNSKQYIIWYRIEQAKKLLRTSDLSIAEISHCFGFLSASNFSAKFRAWNSCSPQQYRLNAQKSD